MLDVRHGSLRGFFLFLSHKFVGAFNLSGLLGSHVCEIDDIWCHSDNNKFLLYYRPEAEKYFFIVKASSHP